jgi:hypothetical protein
MEQTPKLAQELAIQRTLFANLMLVLDEIAHNEKLFVVKEIEEFTK